MAFGNTSFNTILTTTLKNYRNTLVDNVFKDRPLLNHLMSKGQVRTIAGGESIVEQLLGAQNSTFGSYSGYDAIDITPQGGLTAAVYSWKQIAASIAINGLEEAQNNSKEKMIDLLKAKISQAEETMKEGLNEMLFGDGTGNSSKDFDGLSHLVNDAAGPGASNVGGIDATSSDNAWWRSVVLDATDDGDAERNDDEWSNAVYTAAKGNDMFDFGVTTQDLFEHYESGLAPQLRFTSNDEADARFLTLSFKGRKLYYDFYCPEGLTYFLNSKYLKLVGHSGTWFRNTPFKDAPDKDARWSQILSYGNLTVSNRSRQAVVTDQEVS